MPLIVLSATGAVLLLVVINGVAAVALCLLQLWLCRHRNPAMAVPSTLTVPPRFISLHVAIYNEPPGMVIQTLHSLAKLDGVEHEILIIDNNTPLDNVWRPVAEAAEALGNRFRFYHFDGVVGAKAGALNIALELADPRATHIAVIDADYQVHPHFLSDALAAMATSGADYVQFPQAYRGVAPRTRGVERELGDYFACFAGRAGHVGAMLLTGTLSVVDIAALRDVGGWSPTTITEDADLGLRLQAAGRRGVWLPAERGAGVLPLDFDSLQKQRARWVAGNVQCLRKAVLDGSLWTAPADRLALVGQLTAWVSLWLVPAAVLLALALWPHVPLGRPIALAAAATILASAGLTAIRMRLAMPAQGGDAGVWVAALTAKLALTWTASLAWLPALTGRPLKFHRTRKDGSTDRPKRPGAVLAASLLAAVAMAVYAIRGDPAEAAACLLLSLIWPCGRWIDASLRASAGAAA